MGQYIIFRLGPFDFGIDVADIIEITSLKGLRPVPETPEFMLGVIDVRGHLIPVYDLRVRLSIKPDSKKPKVILFETEDHDLGLTVDEVYGIRILDDDDMRQPDAVVLGLKKKYIQSIYSHASDMVLVLNLTALLSSQEKIELKKGRIKAGKA